MKYLFFLLFFSCAHNTDSSNILKKLEGGAGQYHKSVLASEGEYVMCFNQKLAPYISKKLDNKDYRDLKNLLARPLEISLTKKGFAKAAERFLDENKKDETNYDAIWVRDSGWIFFALVENKDLRKAKILLTSLWDYYATKAQRQRFKSIIKNPKLSNDSMKVPHIRFDGNSSDLRSVYLNGKPQRWNHKQNDAHGIFLLALGHAIEKGLINKEDFTKSRTEVLSLFPKYFDRIKYEDFAGAGAWEEVDKINTSSITMVVKSFEKWLEVSKTHKKLFATTKWSKAKVKKLINRGYKRIRKNLAMGGESPDHEINSVSHRREDAALFNIFLPWPLKKLSYSEKLQTLTILEKLKRPFGIIRYPNDSYQGGNYWLPSLQKKSIDGPTLTGDASGTDAFKKRFEKLTPNTEAQWFFDSKLSMIYLQMSKISKNKRSKAQYKNLATLYFKRALGQISGPNQLAADLKPIRNWQVPESINTVLYNQKTYYFASPITPLNWAKASLSMALNRLESSL